MNMAKKLSAQPELQMGAPVPAAPETETLELIDDAPDKVSSDLRKFNRARAEVNKAVAPLKAITVITDVAGVESAMTFMKLASKVEKLIENKRKDLVGPYNDEVKRINTYAKELSEELPAQITRVKGLVLDFQTSEAIRLQTLQNEARHKQLLEMGLVRYDKGTPAVLVDHYFDSIGEAKVYRRDLEMVSAPVWEAILQGITNKREEARQKAVEKLKQERDGASFFGDEDAVAAVDAQIGDVLAVPVSRPAVASAPSFTPTKVSGTTLTWTFGTLDLSQVPREYLMLDETKVRRAIAAGTREIPGLKIFQKAGISLR
jgi:hypothetical protein